jgi:hypothetical protein
LSKTLLNAAVTARDLCRDAFGNGRSGQEERSLRYLALALEQLQALIAALENRQDTRKAIALEDLTRSLRVDTHPAYRKFPDFDHGLIEAAESKWEGRNLPHVLPRISLEDMPPELKAAIFSGKPGQPVSVSLTTEQAWAMFGAAK